MHSTLAARSRLAIASLTLLSAAACMSAGGAQFLPPSRPAEFSLASVPWGVKADSVTALIEPRGYNFNRVDKDGDLWYDGVLYGAPTRIYAFMGGEKANARLVKMRVVISTPDESALTTYQRVRTELAKQYGTPKETVEQYDAKGATKEKAIRSKKADVHTYWLPGGRMAYVSVQVTEQLMVVVDYDGPAWERESLRRRKGS